jgi:hypothetical protein
MKEDEMGRACNTHVGDEKSVYSFGWKILRLETTRKTEE